MSQHTTEREINESIVKECLKDYEAGKCGLILFERYCKHYEENVVNQMKT